jgi:hypothetical protein
MDKENHVERESYAVWRQVIARMIATAAVACHLFAAPAKPGIQMCN